MSASPKGAPKTVKRAVVGSHDVMLSETANQIINHLIVGKGLSYEDAAAACAEATSFFCDVLKAVQR